MSDHDDDDDTKRRGGVAVLADDVASWMAKLGVTLPPLDDEAAWAERDRQVQAQIARRETSEQRAQWERRARVLAEPDGAAFPERALQHAISPRDTQPVLAARRWVPERKNILILSGPCSIGKTVAACIPALHSTAPWHFVRSADYFSASRYDRKERRRLLGAALVLDDLGAEHLDGAGNVLADLDELIDTFYAAARPLVITTNLAAAEMRLRYDSERTISRLREAASWQEMGSAPSLRPPPKR